MKVRLAQGPEGSPNFCFGLYNVVTNECLEFVQSDWDWAGLASRLGWVPCECGRTDGTVDCEHQAVSDMLSSAFDYLSEREGEVFELSDY